MKDFLKYILATAIGTLIGAIMCTVLLIFVVIGLFAIGTRYTKKATKEIKNDTVLVLNFSEPIRERNDEISYLLGGYMAPSLRQITEAIHYAATDKKIEGIYLKLDRVPQGWSTLKTLRQSLAKFKKSKKFIYAYSEFYDEKSYYIASVANKVYMHPRGEFSWNGFASVPAFYKNFFNKIGVRPVIFRVGKYKSAVEPLIQTEMSESNKAQITELIDDIWQDVITVVSRARSLDPLSVEKMAEDLELKTADDAMEKGFVDDLKLDSEIFEGLLVKKSVDKITEKQEQEKLKDIKTYIFANRLNFNTSVGSLFGTELNNDNKEVIALINIEGPIMPGRHTEEGVGSDDLVAQIRKAKYTKNIKGVVIRVNSPGGSALASEVVWSEIQKLREVKPVYASYGDVAASGGYYIGVAAEKIFAHPNTITGSIGVYSVLMDIQKGANEKVGLNFDRVVTHPYADIGSAVRNMTEQEKAVFQKDTERIYKRFVEVVQTGRQYNSFKNVHAIAQGRVWSGIQAKEIGLVDELGNLDDAIASLAGSLELSENYRIQVLRPEVNLDLIFGSLILQPSFVSYLPQPLLQMFEQSSGALLKPNTYQDRRQTRVWALAPNWVIN